MIRALAQAAPNGADPATVQADATTLMSHSDFAATGADSRVGGPLYSTAALMQTEADLLASATRRHGEAAAVCPPAALEAAIAARPTLSEEQEQMIRRLCRSGRGVEVVVGRAGTGKTYALDAARAAWTDAGIPVIGAALAARTAAGLQAGTGIASGTVDQLLADIARPGPDAGLPRRGVLVIDEAGMVGTRKLAALLVAAERSHTKVVLVGDPRQLPEIDAGGAFAALAARDPIELTLNRRQAEPWERHALDQLRHGDVTRAVTIYRDRQRITLADTADTARAALVADWWAARADKDADRVVMIALQRSDVDDLNQRARALRHQHGELDGPVVTSADGHHFAVGDDVMALRNDRRLGVQNGTRATITGVDTDTRQLRAVTADRLPVEIPAGYLDEGHLTHGYALTAHKAQGLTTTRAFVLGSDRLYREAGYTALSRAVERTDLYQVAAAPSGWEPAADPHRELARLLTRSAAQSLATQTPATQPEPVDRAGVRDAALADPGPHLLDRLGPPPTSGPQRAAWAAAATAIDTYRLRHHITAADPIGPAPTDPDARHA